MADPTGTPEDEAAVKARAAERWRRVRGIAAAAGLGALALALRQRAARAPQAGPEEEPGEPGARVRYVTTQAGASWFSCGHGCQKKANPYITSHDCCGRCHVGRVCVRSEGADYRDPERHTFAGTLLYPGECMSCGLPPDAHPWVYDSLRGTRYPSADAEPDPAG